jgi:hypothetical protein
MVAVQDGTCYTTALIKKRYVLKTVTKRFMLLNGTFFILYNECTKPWISWALDLT